MSTGSASKPDDPENDPSQASQEMNERLRGDVALWKAARSESAMRPAAEPTVPVAKPPAPKQETRAKQAKSAPATSQSTSAKKKPFGMSYDGMSQADYISYRISRGAR